VIRTVWLGLLFLVILAAVSSFRFAFGHFDAANASGFVGSADDHAAGTKTVHETLTNADRSVAYVASRPDTELAKADHTRAELSSRTRPAIAAPRIANRHRQEPASSVTRQARDQKPKRESTKREAIADKPQAAAEPRECQLADFDAVRRAFNLPTGCHS